MTNHNDEVDTFRHIYSSAVMALEYGEMASEIFGNTNEILHKNPSEEKVMDYYNNAIGREIGSSLLENIENLKFNNKNEIKEYIAFKTMEAIKTNQAIKNLSDKRISGVLKNIPDHPLRIYTKEKIDKMTSEKFEANEKNIIKNMLNNRIISKHEADKKVQSGDLIWVEGYVRDDGVEVSGYYRRK